MSLDIEKALSDGFDRVLTLPGAYLVAAFLALGFANTVVVQSLTDIAVEATIDEFGPRMAEAGALDEFRDQVGVFPFAVSLPPTLLGAAFVALAFVAEAVSIVAIRVFAAPDPDGLPGGIADGLPLATVNGFVAGIFTFVIVSVGFVVGLLGIIIGGFVVAAFLGVSLVFVRQAVALDDENAIGALSQSWSVAKGDRWYLLGLVVVLFVISLVIGGAGGLVGGLLGPAVNALVNVVVGATVGVFGIAVTTRAYQQLRTEPDGADAGVDDGFETAGSENDVY
jgi:hypothetical protein